MASAKSYTELAAELGFCRTPASLRGLRACKRCRLVKTQKQFDQFGCENVTCGDIDPVLGTTPEFEGTIALIDPSTSWVAEWHGLSKYKPGVYAIAVANHGEEAQAATRHGEDDEYELDPEAEAEGAAAEYDAAVYGEDDSDGAAEFGADSADDDDEGEESD